MIWIPYEHKVNTGDPFRSSALGVMSPARFPCATPVTRLRFTSSLTSSFFKTTKWCEYPMNIRWIPYEHKVNTGDRSRSYVLGVMSPARCPCATPVKCRSVLRPAWRTASVKLLNVELPPTGVDPITSELWALRAADAPRRFMFLLLLIYYCFITKNLSNFFIPYTLN